jgi:hypothetical protein
MNTIYILLITLIILIVIILSYIEYSDYNREIILNKNIKKELDIKINKPNKIIISNYHKYKKKDKKPLLIDSSIVSLSNSTHSGNINPMNLY